MRTYNIIVLVSTAILIATVVTIIFAIAVYIISRNKRRKIQDENEKVSTVIVKSDDTVKNYVFEDNNNIRQIDYSGLPKILKLYDPYKKEENRKNGSEER